MNEQINPKKYQPVRPLQEDEYFNEEDGLRDIRFYDYNFSNDAGINPEIRHAHTYVENWPYLQSRGMGLLILDDPDIERNSDFAQEQIFNVIDRWYCSNKPMIVTTNLTLDELKQPDDIIRAKIYSRILERCVPIRINNWNIREENATKNLQQAKNLFT